MPSVEYRQEKMFEKVEKKQLEHPDTGETVEVDKRVTKNPFELRITKWLKKSSNYHLYGYVKVTEFGNTLSKENTPKDFVENNLEVKTGFNYELLDEVVKGVEAVKSNRFEKILEFGKIQYKNFEVLDEKQDKIKFKLILDGQEIIDNDWLKVDFDPSRGDK